MHTPHLNTCLYIYIYIPSFHRMPNQPAWQSLLMGQRAFELWSYPSHCDTAVYVQLYPGNPIKVKIVLTFIVSPGLDDKYKSETLVVDCFYIQRRFLLSSSLTALLSYVT